MTNEDEMQQWQRLAWMENLYDRWAALICGVAGDSTLAQALCELGMKVVRGEIRLGEATRRDFAAITLPFVPEKQPRPNESAGSLVELHTMSPAAPGRRILAAKPLGRTDSD